MRQSLTYLTCFLVFILFTNASEKPTTAKDYSKKLFLEIGNLDLDYEIFHQSVSGYFFLLNKNKLTNKRYLSIVDMSKSANKERYFLIDMQNKKLIAQTLIAHGKNTAKCQ